MAKFRSVRLRRVLHGRRKIVLLLRIASAHQRPGELARTIPQASRRVLDAQLLPLLAHGIARKTVFNKAVQHAEYELTEPRSSCTLHRRAGGVPISSTSGKLLTSQPDDVMLPAATGAAEYGFYLKKIAAGDLIRLITSSSQLVNL